MTERPTFPPPFRAVALGQVWPLVAQGRAGAASRLVPPTSPSLPRLTAPSGVGNGFAPLGAPGVANPFTASGQPTGLGWSLSSLGHAVLLIGAIYGGWWVTPFAETPVEATQVTLVSEAWFRAMTAPQPQVTDAAALAMAVPLQPETFQETPDAPLPEADRPTVTDLAPDAVIPDAVAPPPENLPPIADSAPPPQAAPAPEPTKIKTVTKQSEPKQVAPKKAAPKKADAKKAAPKKQPAQPASKGATVSQAVADKAGKSGADAAATPSQGQAKALKSTWGGKVRSRVERNKKSPKGGGAASGTVKLRITLARSGALIGVSVVTSSGHEALDAAALRAVQSAAPFPAAPKGLNDASYSFTLPIKFAA